jgi:hypothetical protein
MLPTWCILQVSAYITMDTFYMLESTNEKKRSIQDTVYRF